MTEDLVDFGYEKVPEKEKALRVKDHFDRLAQNYDAMNTLMSFGIHYLWKRAAVRFLDLKAGNRVLDVCGGTGDLAVLAVKKVGLTGKIVLSDINLAMIEAGKRKSTHAGREGGYARAERRRANGVQVELFQRRAGGFRDEEPNSHGQGLREVHRLLKPGGRFVCLEFSRPPRLVSKSLRPLSFGSCPSKPCIAWFAAALTYLPNRSASFRGRKNFGMLAGQVSERLYRLLTNGIAAVHRGEKAPDPDCGDGRQGVRQ